MKTSRLARLIAAPALLPMLLAACATGLGPVATPSPAPSAEQSPAPSAEERLPISVFFLMTDAHETAFLVPVARSVSSTDDPAAAAMRELLAGPTPVERSGSYPGRAGPLAPLSTSIPDGTQLLGMDIQDGVATVDLSGEFGAGDDIVAFVYRQAQIVYTLTQWPTVERVAFSLDGEPVPSYEGHEGTGSAGPATRNLYFDQRRSVFVETPAWGAAIDDPLTVAGIASIDAPIRIALVDGATDTVLAEQTVQPTCDPCMPPDAWGPFEARLSVPAGSRPVDLRLRIWEPPFGFGDLAIAVDYPLSPASGS